MDIKELIKNNILTTSEVSDILQVGKARIAKLNESGELTPIKQTTLGNIYLKAEVEDYKKNKKYGSNIDNKIAGPLFDRDGNTRRSLAYYREHKYELGNIIAIYIFFNDMDAAINNFYIPSDQYYYENLRYCDSPHMILRDSNGKEMWLGGCNCGYGGEGPHGSAEILKDLREDGILNKEPFTDEYIERLIYNHVISMYQDDEESNTWVIKKEKESLIPTFETGGSIYYYDNNLVFIQDPGNMWGNSVDILKSYQNFLPNPVEVRVFPTLEMAKEEGYACYRKNAIIQNAVYNVIIYDSSNRQIWLHTNNIGKNIYKNPEVKEILSECGFQVKKEIEEDTLAKIFRWLNTTLSTKPVQPISYKKDEKNKGLHNQ